MHDFRFYGNDMCLIENRKKQIRSIGTVYG